MTVYGIDEMQHAPDAVAIIDMWSKSDSPHSEAHKIAVYTLNELLCHSEPSGMSARCDWCEGGAAVYTIPVEGEVIPDAVCVWCIKDKMRIDKKEEE